MSDKKHIDRLFQEKFKDFEAKPNANVWVGIENKMEVPLEKTKTGFPIWFRFASIAAALVLLFTVGNLLFNTENTENTITTIVDSNTESNPSNTLDPNVNTKTENPSTTSNRENINSTNPVLIEDKNSLKKNNNDIINKKETIENTAVVSSEKDSKNNTFSTKTLQNKVNNIKDASKESNTNTFLANQTNNTKNISLNSENKNDLNTADNALIQTDRNSAKRLNSSAQNSNNKTSSNTYNRSKNITKQLNTDVSSNVTSENTFAQNKKASNTNNTSRNLTEQLNTAVSSNVPSENTFAQNKTASSTNNTSKDITEQLNTAVPTNTATENTFAQNNLNNNNSTINSTSKKPSTLNISELENNNASTNTAVAATNSEKEKEEEKMMDPDSANSSNAIEEALAKTEENLDEKEENLNRWSVNANAAPVYYNTLGKGSHIHDQFVDNPKNGEINTSYGVNVGYTLNNKLKLRSGINKLNLSYDTANVIVYENVTNTPSSSPLRNIDFTPTNEGQNISVLSTNSLSVQQIDGFINDDLNAALSQRLSYFEVPLELEYAVVNKRFGFNIIGGFSTFILSGNEVVTEVDNRKTKIGEANNINNLSFSANAGIGIDYKFNKSIKFNLEPTFKYQINAYSDTSGDFRPYIIGVYTGISYKF